MEKTRTQKSMTNIIFSLGSQGVELILKVVGRTIFIRYLAIEYLGVNGLFGEILTVLSLAELGIGSALGYALYKPLREDNKNRIAALMDLYRKAYTIIGISVAVIGALLIPFLDYIVKDPGKVSGELKYIYLFYLFNTSITYFYSYKGSLLTADQKNYMVQTIREVSNITRTALQIVTLVIWRNFYLYLAVESLCIFANNYFVSKFVDKKYRYLKTLRGKEKLDKASIKQIIKNIKALFLTKISTILVNSTDNTIISAICGIVVTGLYSNYVMFTTLINTVLGQIFGALYPSIGNLNAEGDRKRSKSVFYSLNIPVFWLFSFASIGLFVLVNDVITVWIGKSYLLSFAVVTIIAVNIYMFGMQKNIWLFKDSYGLFVYGQYMSIVGAVTNIFFSIVLGRLWGLFGILFATAITRAITTVWYDPFRLFKHGFFGLKKSGTIHKQNVGVSILLSIVTLGFYKIYWQYLIVKNIKTIRNEKTGCVKEILLLVFVPFYYLYWWFVEVPKATEYFDKNNYPFSGNRRLYLILGIFGLDVVSLAIMQKNFNSLPLDPIDYDRACEDYREYRKSLFDYYIIYAGYTLLFIVTCALTYFSASLIPLKGWISLFVKLFVVCVIPNIVYFLVFFRTKSFKYIKERLFSVVFKRAG